MLTVSRLLVRTQATQEAGSADADQQRVAVSSAEVTQGNSCSFFNRVFSRSWQGLWNTLQLTVLHDNLVHAGLLTTWRQLKTGVASASLSTFAKGQHVAVRVMHTKFPHAIIGQL